MDHQKWWRAAPTLRCEPLDEMYAIAQARAAATPLFIDDLCRHLGWRGAVAACWLTMLTDPSDCPCAIIDLEGRWPLQAWLIEWARTGEGPAGLKAGIAQLRALLDQVQWPVPPLRRSPNAADQAEYDATRAAVREAYATGGADAARAVLDGTALADWLKPYPAWVRGRSTAGG
jgi:hypothetical protein